MRYVFYVRNSGVITFCALPRTHVRTYYRYHHMLDNFMDACKREKGLDMMLARESRDFIPYFQFTTGLIYHRDGLFPALLAFFP